MQENNENLDILSMFELDNKKEDILSNIVFEENKNENLDLLNNCETNFQEEDILSSFNLSNETNEIPVNTQESEKLEEVIIEEKKTNKIVEGIKFLTNYLTTSAVIFFILLGVLNYNSYIQIAKSYFNKEGIELDKNAMLASVSSSNISKKEEPNEEKTLEKQKEEEFEFNAIKQAQSIKNKTFHSMDKLVDGNGDNDINIDVSITPYENRIIIPKIGKNIPLLDVKAKKVKDSKELENIFMEELTSGVVRYPGTAKPGEEGNSFIFGHSSNFPWIKGDYNDVFALIDNVVIGDEVIAYYGQKKYIYKINERVIIKPGDVSILKRNMGKKEISIMTCWPIGTTLNRFIIIGELVEEK